MDVSKIIAKCRTQTGTSVWQKSDELMLQDLNLVYKEIFSRLSTKSKKYTWNTFTTDTIVWQNEYIAPKDDNEDTWLKRLLKVSVKYNDGYVPCKMFNKSVAIDENYDNENAPYCLVRDWSIFIYPAPKTAITDWIVVEWQYVPLDLLLDTTSEDIKLNNEYHDILLSWLNMWTFWDKQLFDKKAVCKQEFEEWFARMVEEWWADIESWYETDNAVVHNVSQQFLP